MSQWWDLDKLVGSYTKLDHEKKLTDQEKELLWASLFTPGMLLLQRLLDEQINGKLNEMMALDMSEASAITRAARIQGMVQGMRQFWAVAEELIKKEDEE